MKVFEDEFGRPATDEEKLIDPLVQAQRQQLYGTKPLSDWVEGKTWSAIRPYVLYADEIRGVIRALEDVIPMVRAPNGVAGQEVFQKDLGDSGDEDLRRAVRLRNECIAELERGEFDHLVSMLSLARDFYRGILFDPIRHVAACFSPKVERFLFVSQPRVDALNSAMEKRFELAEDAYEVWCGLGEGYPWRGGLQSITGLADELISGTPAQLSMEVAGWVGRAVRARNRLIFESSSEDERGQLSFQVCNYTTLAARAYERLERKIDSGEAIEKINDVARKVMIRQERASQGRIASAKLAQETAWDLSFGSDEAAIDLCFEPMSPRGLAIKVRNIALEHSRENGVDTFTYNGNPLTVEWFVKRVEAWKAEGRIKERALELSRKLQ